MFLTGETPECQLLPTMRWMAMELGVRQWCIIGDNYVWPWGSAKAARNYAERCGARILDEIYVELGTAKFTNALRRIESSGAQGVLMFLVGNDAVRFNRAFAAAGLDERMLRLTPLMEENMLLASGAAATKGIYTASGFFESAATAEGLDFVRPLYHPLWPGSTRAEQHGRILLRGRTSACRAHPAGRRA